VEALFKQVKLYNDINFLLVSDASGSVDIEKRSGIKPDKKLKRLILIAIDRIRSVRARKAMSFFIKGSRKWFIYKNWEQCKIYCGPRRKAYGNDN
jgi:hypothetical protein